MPNPTYRPVGPLLAGTRSTAVLGLEERADGPGRAVVLVWAPADLARDEERTAQLRRDTRRASELDHPHIVRVHGLASLEQGLARVVEFVDGESLRQVLDLVAPLPPRIAARIVADVALGAHYAHLAGNDDGSPMVHGDLRPETVMITYAGKAKASGYGALAVAPREASGLRVVNRRRYAAPEQIIGGRTASTPQTDVFLLGLLLHEMVSGKKPWDGEAELDHAVVAAPLPLGPEHHIPPELVPVLERATRKRAADRYPTALAFRDAVDQAVSLAPHGDVAAFMERHFPRENSPRAARAQVLAEAVAAQSRRQAEARARAPKPAPPPQPAREAEPESIYDWRSRMPIVFGLVVAVVLVGAIVYRSLSAKPPPMIVSPPGTPTAAAVRTEPPPAPGPPATPQPIASRDVPKPETRTDASPVAQAKPAPSLPGPTPAEGRLTPPPAPGKAPSTLLELTVEPAVEVTLDGVKVGRSPVTVPAAPGKRLLQLIDRSRGIDVKRAVVVGKEGVTRQTFTIGRGTLSVRMPDGAALSLDGRLLGAHPPAEIPVYEGTHHLKVTLGDAVWQETFAIRPDQTLKYDVALKPSASN
ncbi:MAG TPA: protein kinase [Myxococcaceae bacterium]|nr:protein kinase [Myxococcaceae bacterium]